MAIKVVNLTSYPKNPRAGYTVIMQVTGPAEEVRCWIEHYMQEFHPCGYGTRIADRKELPEGQVQVTVRRSDSCD